MEKVTATVKALLAEDSEFKQASSELLTDHLMILRQTKVDPETDKLLTKYLNVNSLVSTEHAVKNVFTALNSAFGAFTFTKEWNMSIVTN
jgi:hypothetical protein